MNDPDLSSEEPDPAARARRGPSLPAILVLGIACVFFASAATYWVDHRPERVGAVDVGFFDDMSTHHLQAITMASIYARNGNDEVFRNDAFEINFSQAGDIRQMQTALLDWGRSGTPDVAMEWMGMHTPQNAQPGMATPNQLAALTAARGPQLDDLFSALMINHHAGGIHMADYAMTHAKTKLARELARLMLRDQRLEIIDLNSRRVHLGLPRHEPGDPIVVPTS